MTESEAENAEKKKPGPPGTGRERTGEQPTATGKNRSGAEKKNAPHLVERMTGLRGQSICRPQKPQSMRRRLTQLDFYEKDPEIPYVKFEAAARDLVCSLIERQDRMNEEIFSKIIDLQYRVDDIEQDRKGARTTG